VSFTDHDLKRLKEALEHPQDFVQKGDEDALRMIFEPLLVRLEAAEKVCELYMYKFDKAHPNRADIPLLETWRKAAGK